MKPTFLLCTILVLGLASTSLAGFVRHKSAKAAGAVSGKPGRMSGDQLVRAYYGAYEKKDWNSLVAVLADGFTFSSPVDEHISLKEYKEKCWPNCENTKRFEIKKLVVDGDDAFVTYNGWTNAGKMFRNTEYFEFKDGKIKSDECFFGPGVNYPNSGK
jgi:ketosteroid isomerase-like protein